MSQSNFAYLEKEFPILFNIGQADEYQVHTDPVTALFKLRQFEQQHFPEQKVDKLPQAILAKAFRGELVSQDVNDESAEVLLERIKNV